MAGICSGLYLLGFGRVWGKARLEREEICPSLVEAGWRPLTSSSVCTLWSLAAFAVPRETRSFSVNQVRYNNLHVLNQESFASSRKKLSVPGLAPSPVAPTSDGMPLLHPSQGRVL